MMEIKEMYYEGIPFTIYNVNDQRPKPLIYFFHGFTSDRALGIMGRGEILAKKGFFVVAIDAYLHGERKLDFFQKLPNSIKFKDFINIVMHTANDAKLLYEKYFVNLDFIKKDKVYAYGVSMGASVAFYLATIFDKLQTIASIVGSPSFVEFYRYFQSVYNWELDDYFKQNLAYYYQYCPLINYERLIGKKIFMGCGDKDTIVPARFAYELSKKLLSNDVVYQIYDTGHLSTDLMQEAAYQFLIDN